MVLHVPTSYGEFINIGTHDDDRRMDVHNLYVELPRERTVLTPAEALRLAAELLRAVADEKERGWRIDA